MSKHQSYPVRKPEVAPKPHVLIVARDKAHASLLDQQLALDGMRATVASTYRDALQQVAHRHYAVAILELRVAMHEDINLISYIRRQSPHCHIVLLFEMNDIEHALEGIRQGAFFYLPIDTPPADIALVVRKAVRQLATQSSLRQFEASLFQEMLGHSAAMKRILEKIQKVAPTDSTVLLLGESGTGKELMANTVHRLSNRADMPFVAVNCAALPETLLESELFGHVKGAFTGAHQDKQGLFKEADGGTIFLDEIGDMSLVTQSKLLRVLQNGDIRQVGSSTTERVNVRVIAATNRNLEEDVQHKQFREDLYYRLNVIQIRIPPLRERMDALPKLIEYFVKRYNLHRGKNIVGLDESASALLQHYPYPGNVRELESIIAHAVIMADTSHIRATDLPDQVRHNRLVPAALPNLSGRQMPTLKEMEVTMIQNALSLANGNQTEAARILGISRSTLWRKLHEYGLDHPKPTVAKNN